MKTFDFQRAVPIWAKEREREMNCELAFRAAISGAGGCFAAHGIQHLSRLDERRICGGWPGTCCAWILSCR